MTGKKPKYYDWERTLSYDADVTMVIGARGIGKTFGLRMQCMRDFIRDGSRFCEIVRFKNSLSVVSDGYYDRLSTMSEFDGYVFKTDSRYAWIAEKPTDDNRKPMWRKAGYFVALSDGQIKKMVTFSGVRRLIFDEAILERADRYHKYLPGEYGSLAKLVDTVSRERADTDGIRPRVYLLGNACDLANPYFAAYHVTADLKYGYRWYSNKTFLLHYVDPGSYAVEKARGTVAGRMMANTEAGMVASSNMFIHADASFVSPKTKNAKFSFGIVYVGKRFGIWYDQREGYYYVTDSIPNNTGKPVYSLTRDDLTINYVAATNLGTTMGYVRDMYTYSLLRYQSEDVMMAFGEVLQLFGIR